MFCNQSLKAYGLSKTTLDSESCHPVGFFHNLLVEKPRQHYSWLGEAEAAG